MATLYLTIIDSSSSSSYTVTECDSYTWNGTTYDTSGTYTWLGTNAVGCDSVSILNLTITGNPIAVITQNGIDLEVTVAYTYIWSTGETIQSITPTVNGMYWCVITDTNGCVSDTAYFEVTNIPSGINNVNISKLLVYPNPSKDIFNITFTSNSFNKIKLRVINIVGKVIFSESLEQFVGQYKKQINLNSNPKAIYFLEIETDDGIINKKLILQ